MPGTHSNMTASARGPHTHHPVILDHELLERRIEPERCVLLLDDHVEEPCGECRPDSRNSLAARHDADRAEDKPRASCANHQGVDHARPRSQTSSVLIGMATGAWHVPHAVPIRLTSKGFTSTARPTLPPGQLGVVVRVGSGSHQLDAVLLSGRDEVGNAIDERLLAFPRAGQPDVTDRGLQVDYCCASDVEAR